MNKTARYSLIASICAAHGFGPKLSAVVMPTRSDTREEITLSVSEDDKRIQSGADMRDEDLPALGSALKFDSAKVRSESEKDSLLTPRERAELRADLLAYRIRQDFKRAEQSRPYALAIIC